MRIVEKPTLAGVVIALALATACGAGQGQEPNPDLTVTMTNGASAEVSRCGTIDEVSIALEDGSGDLLVPAVSVEGPAAKDEPYTIGSVTLPKTCETEYVLTDIPPADMYQIVHAERGAVHRTGFRRGELESLGWRLEIDQGVLRGQRASGS